MTAQPGNQRWLPLIALGTIVLVVIAVLVLFLWPDPSGSSSNDGLIVAGDIDTFEIGVPVRFLEGRFWLVRLDGRRFLALSWKDPFRGCTVPWLPNFLFGEVQGWFRNPCYGQTYDLEGYCHFGPCTRGLDRFHVQIEDERVVVDPRRVELGPPLLSPPCLPSYPRACIREGSNFTCIELYRNMPVLPPDPLGLDPDGNRLGCE